MKKMYRLARPLLFCLSPERSHDLTLSALALAARTRVLPLTMPDPVLDPVTCMGIEFRNRVGLAAGLDKNAQAIDAWPTLGFGFFEIGTVTPQAQPGNAEPRLFRITGKEAIINRMGFNNEGVTELLTRVRRWRKNTKTSTGAYPQLGINIGKNRDTPVARAVDDYVYAMEAAYPLADYIAVNLSSPNTPGLRDLQFGQALDDLLFALREKRKQLEDVQGVRRPVVVKIAPDMASDDLYSVADRPVNFGIDGVIATNTTLDRAGVAGLVHADESGGLSGLPLFDRSTQVVAQLSSHLQGALTIIGVGGIHDAEQAQAKRRAGADLVQLYTGLIYRGPGLIHDCARALRDGAL